jgi:type VI secretion system protein ImpK
MELQYLALAFGFGGKYAALDRGYDRLAAIQQDLYRKIRSQRGTPQQELSLRWHGLEDRRNPLIRYVPWWVVGAAALAILAVAYTAYYARLADWAEPVHAELAKVGLDDEAPPATAPVSGPTLKQLLAPEEANRTMRVDEEGGRTLVTLLASDLFASGSATVAPAHYDTLQRLARALNQVPGRVRVVGHTDDQAIRSVRFRDNFELSRERALSVVKVLQLGMENHGRVTAMGVGSTEPRYRPESTSENRARNRRVEILHIRGL